MTPDLYRQINFPQSSEADWRKLVDKALKGADFDAALVSTTDDGIAYGPIAGRDADGTVRARCQPSLPWTLSQRLDDPDAERAAAQLAADLDGGATGITICLEDAPASYAFGISHADLDRHLGAIPSVGELRFETSPQSTDALLDAVEKHADTDIAHVDLGLAPSAALASDSVARAFDLDIDCTVFRADGRLAHNAGASEAQELGFALAAAVEGLRLAEAAGIDLRSALAATEFTLAADQNQFLTISKLRALRDLHARLQEALSVSEPFAAHIHAETSFRMLALRDPETNILRNTIAVFAAGVGGADSISVLPHTFAQGLPDRFARRIARNTQAVLIEECHLAHVVDPGAGSGGVEHLTGELAAAGWAEFQRIESEGGLPRSLSEGLITQRIAATRESRERAVSDGTLPIIGTTAYRAAKERPISVLIPRRPSEDRSSLAPRPLHRAFRQGEAA